MVISALDVAGQDAFESPADWLRGDLQLAGVVGVRQQTLWPGQPGSTPTMWASS